ncbi:MAG: efflux RND transporter permease subunit [Selenomonas sp.]|uniref:efflux RND transporter permease subunit n=1 Tax=Selenomonas sp. TaxID=2053611 RepID=UPI0025EFDC57|nr:efflux RND transporter permease subunit [Selenomonas sp.]MCR5758459.1 efflux RND transporter permease subunit [Selenomonas sp.]
MSLPELSIKRPVLATVMTAALVLLGIVSLFKLSIAEYPNMSYPYVSVQITYDGARPEQMDAQIVRKVEEAVSEAKGVRHITSTSTEGSADIGVEFAMEVDPAAATQEVRDKVNAIKDDLPKGINEPVVSRFDMNADPVAAIAITSDKLSQRELSILVEEQVKPAIQQIAGVGKLSVFGEEKREVQLLMRPESLRAFALAPAEVAENIEQGIKEVPGGNLDSGTAKLSVSTKSKIVRPQDFNNLMVAQRGGQPVYFRQIGEARDTIKDRTSAAHYDGVQAIGIEVGKQSGGNAVKVAAAVKEELTKLQKTLPDSVQVHLVRDDAQRIKDSMHGVYEDLVIGGIFAVFVVFLFLGDLRSTLISAVTIPTSLISTFFFMNQAGFSINTMTMLGLSLAIGLLIDDAIVVVENIIRHREQGEDPQAAAALGTKEIVLAVMATSFSVIAVFMPMGFMTGSVADFFKEFGLTISFAVLISLFISFTLTPMLASKFLRPELQPQGFIWEKQRQFSRFFDTLALHYGELLTKILAHHRRKTALLAVGLFVVSLSLLNFIGMDMLPPSDKGQFTVKYELQDGVSLGKKEESTQQLVDIIRQHPAVEHVYATSSATDAEAMFVKLKPKKERDSQTEVVAQLREQLNAVPGVKIYVEGLSDSGDRPIAISLTGTDMQKLGEASDMVVKALEEMPGATDVTSSYRPGAPRLSVMTKDARAHDLGVSNETIGNTVSTLIEGKKTGKFSDTDEQVDVRLRLTESARENPSQLNFIQVVTGRTDTAGNKQLVPLSAVADWKYETSPGSIRRYERRMEVRISANVDGVSLGEFEQQWEEKLERLQLPPGVSTGSAGEATEMDETMKSILQTLVLGIAFIFMILAAQFESFLEPLAIMAALPLAFIGALAGLLIFGSGFSMISGIGILLLMGLVTKNAILLVDYAKERMAEGRAVDEALVMAGKARFRPIFMTTAAMMMGMLPLAMALGPGAEARAPMAHAILGGLVTSTILTLVVIPCLYSLLRNALDHRQAKDDMVSISPE